MISRMAMTRVHICAIACLGTMCLALSACAVPAQDSAVQTTEAAPAEAAAEATTEARDESQDLQTGVFFATSSPVKELAQTLARLFQDSRTLQITEASANNALIVRGTPDDLEEVHQLLKTLDRPKQMASFSVIVFRATTPMAEADLPKGSLQDVASAVKKMENEEMGYVVNRVQMTALEGISTMMQVGQRKGVETNSMTTARGRQSQVEFMEVGSLLQVTHRVNPDDSILTEFNYTLSRLDPSASAGGDSEEEGGRRMFQVPNVETLTYQSTVRLENGQAIMVTGNLEQDSNESGSSYYIFVGADLIESDRAVVFRSHTDDR